MRPWGRRRAAGWCGGVAAAILLCVRQAAAADGTPPAATADAERLRQAVRADYVLQCAGCHRVDGRGSSPHGIPDFRQSVGAFVHLSEGREYLIRVPGAAHSQLSNAELAAVLNWVLGEFSAAQLPRISSPIPRRKSRQRDRIGTTMWCPCAMIWRKSSCRWASRCLTIRMAETENLSPPGT